ncbi:MAG: membrane protein insertase YidC [Planctomycetota bacterium]
MENRITNLLLPIIVVVLGLFLFQGLFGGKDKAKEGGGNTTRVKFEGDVAELPGVATPQVHKVLKRRVGELGGPGFDLVFDTTGGTLRSARLLDVWSSTGEAETRREEEGRYLVVDPFEDAKGSFFSFDIEVLAGRDLVRDPAGKDTAQLNEVQWELVEGELAPEEGVRFRLALDNGLVWEKDFLFQRGSRELVLALRLVNRGGLRNQDLRYLKYRLFGAKGLPREAGSAAFMMPPRVAAAAAEDGGFGTVRQLTPDGKPNDGYANILDLAGDQRFGFAASTTRFFTSIIRPDDEATAGSVESVALLKLPWEDHGATKANQTGAPVLTVRHPFPKPVDGQAESRSEVRFLVYLGPKQRSYFADHPDLEPFLAVLDLDLEPGCFCTPPGTQLVAKGLLGVLKLFHELLTNWGVAIILLTLVVRAGMLPLTLRQQKSMRAFQEKSSRLKPQMDAIKEKFAKDPQKMNKALMQFQREHKLFPPLGGCLPLLITMPIFFGLFTMLRASYELRHAPAFLWIQDLSQPDRLFSLGLPGMFSHFNLLPLLMMALWTYSAFSTTLPEDPQQRSVQRMMRFMPLIFGVMLYNYASGLALYMVASATWTIVEQRVIKKKYGSVAPGASPI